MRYFIETSYKGTSYSGFQVQQNSNTIQAEIEKALQVYFKQTFTLTGSSRTDAGVHALQNYFHFDTPHALVKKKTPSELATPKTSSPAVNSEAHFYSRNADLPREQQAVYHINAILPRDIVIKRMVPVGDNAHCRFDALSREYHYFIYQNKDPFVEDRAFYFPYKPDLAILNECAKIISSNKDFTSFSKKNTQVHNFICNIEKSEWTADKNFLIYTVRANRFLRGMVKALTGTMLRAATGKISIEDFGKIIESKDCTKADFSVPSHGLFLVKVNFNPGIFSSGQ